PRYSGGRCGWRSSYQSSGESPPTLTLPRCTGRRNERLKRGQPHALIRVQQPAGAGRDVAALGDERVPGVGIAVEVAGEVLGAFGGGLDLVEVVDGVAELVAFVGEQAPAGDVRAIPPLPAHAVRSPATSAAATGIDRRVRDL